MAGNLMEKHTQVCAQLALLDDNLEIVICCDADCTRAYIAHHAVDMLFVTHVDGFADLPFLAIRAGVPSVIVLTNGFFRREYTAIADHFPLGCLPDSGNQVHFLRIHTEPHVCNWRELFYQAQIASAH